MFTFYRGLITSARLAGDRPRNENDQLRGSQHSANAVLTLETIEGAQEAHMSIRVMTALAAAILLCTGATASAATKRHKTTTAYRSSPRTQAVVPSRRPAFDPNSPAATGGGSLGYNQNLYNW
jgi:hypothetical protein